jgi:hypothetical protein
MDRRILEVIQKKGGLSKDIGLAGNQWDVIRSGRVANPIVKTCPRLTDRQVDCKGLQA